MKYTPDNILSLRPNEVFIFGANRRFAHGVGAARQALQWGARHGYGGLQGQTYALPTKDENILTLPLPEIQKEINKFFKISQKHPYKIFLVTAVGTGLAGYDIEDIAPLFSEIYAGIKDGKIKNITLPQKFCEFLESRS